MSLSGPASRDARVLQKRAPAFCRRPAAAYTWDDKQTAERSKLKVGETSSPGPRVDGGPGVAREGDSV